MDHFSLKTKGIWGGISSTCHLKQVKQTKTCQKSFVSPWVYVWPFDCRFYREDGERLRGFAALQFGFCARADGAGLWLLRPLQRIFLVTLSHFTSPWPQWGRVMMLPLFIHLSCQASSKPWFVSTPGGSDRLPGELDVHNSSSGLAFRDKITLRDWTIKGNILAMDVPYCYEQCLINWFSISEQCRAVEGFEQLTRMAGQWEIGKSLGGAAERQPSPTKHVFKAVSTLKFSGK